MHTYDLLKMKQLHNIMISALMILTVNGALVAGPVSELKSDETLVFFTTSAWFNADAAQWHVPIHGWVYEPEDSLHRKEVVSKTFATAFDLETDSMTQKNFDQRVNLLLADNERNKTIVIRFADRTYALPKSSANGHFSKTLLVDDSIFKQHNIKQQLNFQAVLKPSDTRQFMGQVNLISGSGVSIISDIDDTIKISAVTDRKQLMNQTFYQEFKAVNGMAATYQKWLQNDGALHFVSSSPWQLYPVLKAFIQEAGFPAADFHLKSFRFKDSSFLNLFAQGTTTKPPQIQRIIRRYPNRSFILVGDSGEHDPEVYTQIQQQFPQQIKQILIRNVTAESLSDVRFQNLMQRTGSEIWQLFQEVDEIKPLPQHLLGIDVL